MRSTFSLVFERGLSLPTVVDLNEGTIVIGSSVTCDVVIPDRFVSRRHAEICVDGASIEVRDLNTINGTAINGERLVNAAATVHAGDSIELAAGRVVARIISSHKTEMLPAGTVIGRRSRPLSVDLVRRSVMFEGRLIPIGLSPRQWSLLGRLCAANGRPVGASELKQVGWPQAPRSTVSDVSLRTQISRVRTALRTATSGEVTVSYVQGSGYLLS